MTIKDVLLNGGSINFSYKKKEKEWVGKASIALFPGGFVGMKPKIIVEIPTIKLAIGGRKEFELNKIDEAISIFEKLVFNKNNLSYKQTESLIELYEKGENIELDEPNDLKKVRRLQKEKQNGN